MDKGASISWGEVLFGKKGKAYELDKDETDWDKGKPVVGRTPSGGRVVATADRRERARP